MAMRTRILFVDYCHEMGGGIVCLYHLVKALDRRKWEAVILTGFENHLTNELKREGTRVLRFRPTRNGWKNFLQILKAIRKTRPDIVHPFDELASNTEAVLAAKACGVKCVCQLMGENPLKKKHVPVAWLADRLICVSEAVKRHYFKYPVPRNRFRVIHFGTAVSAFDPQLPGTDFRERHGLHAKDQVITSLGRLAGLKGFDYFLQACALVSKKFPRARFMVVGIGSEAGNLKRLAARLGIAAKTVFTGQVKRPEKVYAASDLIVLSSTYRDAFSNVLLEAFAMGKPAVATTVGGNPEIIDSEKVGRLVPPKNAEKLAETLEELLANEDLRRAIGKNARKAAEKRLDIQKTTIAIENVYEEVLGR